jgi:hypothetical protein
MFPKAQGKHKIKKKIPEAQQKFEQISVLRRDLNEICALMGFYATQNGNTILTFRDNLSVPSLKLKFDT